VIASFEGCKGMKFWLTKFDSGIARLKKKPLMPLNKANGVGIEGCVY
jgi:hypothetical protein